MRNTTLEDICAVIGFEAAKHLSAWFGGGNRNVWVPEVAEEGQLLVKVIGLEKARLLAGEWGHQHLMVPSMADYNDLVVRRQIGRMAERGFGSREIASHFRMGERRVQQICRELADAGLIEISAKSVQKKEGGAAALPQIVPPARMAAARRTRAAGSGHATAPNVVRHRLRG